MILLSVVAATVGCGSKQASEQTVDELGIVITVPGDWKRTSRADGKIAFVSGLDGVLLGRDPEPVTTLDAARARLIVGAKISEQKQLPTGGFLFRYDVDYGTKAKPMVLPHVEVLLPTPGGTVVCELQLQPNQDPAPIAAACSSMRAK